jgi:Phytanoyl-CoA dioxygenase (PhyH)
MQLDPDGAQHFPAVFGAARIASLRAFFSSCGESARIAPTPGLAEQLRPATDLVRRFLPGARPVFARWFDKSPRSNWSLGWHQDRTVALAARRDVAGFSRWTVKAGIPHAVPPFEILGRMLTLRLHLDAIDEANAPLLIAPGSHRLGLVPEAGIAAAVARCGTRPCLAKAGDAWLYAAPIVHASDRARAPARRRVLQIAYSADRLLGGLGWAGV